MSLTARLLAGMALIAVLLAVASVAIVRATEANLVDQIDQQLARSTPQLRGDRFPRLGEDRDPGGRPPSPLYVGVIDDESGTVRTVLLPGTIEAEPVPPAFEGDELDGVVRGEPFTVDATEGDLRYRVVIQDDRRLGATVVYGLPLEDVDASTDRLVALVATVSVAIIAALGLVTFWVLRLGVRPIRQMTRAAAAIGEGDLSQRVPEATAGTEAAELGQALNQMLGRIEDSFDERARGEERLRRFVADASHELRTPVTTIRGYAELYRMGGLEDRPALDEAMRRTEQEAARMGSLVRDLLDLARLDEGRPLDTEPLDLADLAADAVADARAVEPSRPITFDAGEPVPMVGDEALVRQVLANLLANVRVHTPADTAVTVRVRRAPGSAVVEVADRGPGMAPEVAAHAFERFYRADPARTRRTGGSGLGLSIVSSIVTAHHGSAEVVPTPGGGTTVRISLPAS